MTDHISDQLAAALRNYPCRCITIGEWPLFKAEAAGTPERPGKHVPKQCPRCKALEAFDLAKAQSAIVQTPQSAACDAMRAAADRPGERHD